MTGRLAGKVAVVTGGGSGLGAAACAAFAREGAAVLVADLSAASAEAVAAGVRAAGGTALGLAADVRSEADSAAMVAAAEEAYGPVDVLHTCAGVAAVGSAGRTEREVWDLALAVLLTGTWLSIQAVLPGMRDRGTGSVVTMGSVAGLVGVKALAPYSAAKGGVIALTRQVAVDSAPYGVRANVVCPGMIDTPLAEATLRDQVAAGLKTPRTYRQGLAGAVEHYPLGRLGTPADVAALATYLAGDESGWVTGQVFAVDGGLTAT